MITKNTIATAALNLWDDIALISSNDAVCNELYATIESSLVPDTRAKLRAWRLLDCEETVFSNAVDMAFIIGLRCAGGDPADLLAPRRTVGSGAMTTRK